MNATALLRLYVDNMRRTHHCYCWAKQHALENEPRWQSTADWYWAMADRMKAERDDFWSTARFIKPKRRNAA